MNMPLTTAQIAACRVELGDWAALTPPSDDALRAVLEADSGLVAMLHEQHPNPGEFGLGDTMDRSEVMGVVARHFCQRDWPTYGEGEAVALAFKEKLLAGTRAAGWTFQPD